MMGGGKSTDSKSEDPDSGSNLALYNCVTLDKGDFGNSLVVQWLGLCVFTAKSPGFDPLSGN